MTRNATSTLKTVLTVVAVVSMPTTLGVRAAAVLAGAAQAAPASMSDRAKFVGTYRLITTEVKDAASGDWVQRPNFNGIGYITYADTGHMGVHIMARSRPPFASNPPTGEEARSACRTRRSRPKGGSSSGSTSCCTRTDTERKTARRCFMGTRTMPEPAPPTLSTRGRVI